jgi:acylphosphatase
MSANDHARLHAIVAGLVQGVGFRQYTVHHASRLRLTGWVTNRRDRKVEVVAEGTRADLETLLEALREGPRSAMVRDVDVTWLEATGEFHTFDVA